MDERRTRADDAPTRPLGERPPDPDRAYVVRHEEEIVGTKAGSWRGVGFLRARRRVDSVRVDEVLAREVEDVAVERQPAEEGDGGGILHLPDGSISIPVYEEQLVVTKRIVLRERVVIRKSVETVTERIRDELRRERVEFEADDGLDDRVVDDR